MDGGNFDSLPKCYKTIECVWNWRKIKNNGEEAEEVIISNDDVMLFKASVQEGFLARQ